MVREARNPKEFGEMWGYVKGISGIPESKIDHLSPKNMIDSLHNVPVVEKEEIANKKTSQYYLKMQCAIASMLLRIGYDEKTGITNYKVRESHRNVIEKIQKLRQEAENKISLKKFVEGAQGKRSPEADNILNISIPEKVYPIIPEELLKQGDYTKYVARLALAEYLKLWKGVFADKWKRAIGKK